MVVVAVDAVDIAADDLHAEPDVLSVQIVGDQRDLYLALNLSDGLLTTQLNPVLQARPRIGSHLLQGHEEFVEGDVSQHIN